MKQGEIYLVDLDPVVGFELGGPQFVVVVSNDMINATFLPVTVVPARAAATTPTPRVMGVLVPADESGLVIDVIVDCTCVRSLDRSRFPSLPAGTLSGVLLKDVEKALHFVFRV